MLTIANMKHPGSTKSAIRKIPKKLFALEFGGKMNGMAKWKIPNPKMNLASNRAAFKAFITPASLTFFSTNNLKII
jgi:hypothetical protein